MFGRCLVAPGFCANRWLRFWGFWFVLMIPEEPKEVEGGSLYVCEQRPSSALSVFVDAFACDVVSEVDPEVRRKLKQGSACERSLLALESSVERNDWLDRFARAVNDVGAKCASETEDV